MLPEAAGLREHFQVRDYNFTTQTDPKPVNTFMLFFFSLSHKSFLTLLTFSAHIALALQ